MPQTQAAEALITGRRYREALALLREDARRDPSDDRVPARIADVYILLGRRDKAVTMLTRIANRMALKGLAGKAVAALKKIQQIDPTAPELYESVAAVLLEQGQIVPTADEPIVLPIEDDEIDLGGVLAAEPTTPVASASDAPGSEASEVSSPLFEDFNHAELLAFMRGLELQLYEPGDVIVAQGDRGASLFILTTGTVKAFLRESSGRHRQVRTMSDGDFFGEVSILQGGTRSATITAATHCEILELDRPALDEIVAAYPGVHDVMQKFCDERRASDPA